MSETTFFVLETQHPSTAYSYEGDVRTSNAMCNGCFDVAVFPIPGLDMLLRGFPLLFAVS